MKRESFNKIITSFGLGLYLVPLEGVVNAILAQSALPDYIEVANLNRKTGKLELPPTMFADGFGLETIVEKNRSYLTLNIPTIGEDFPYEENAENQLVKFKDYRLSPSTKITRIEYNTLNQVADVFLSNGKRFQISVDESFPQISESSVYIRLDNENYESSIAHLFSPVEKDIGVRRKMLELERERPQYRLDYKDGVVKMTQILSRIPVERKIIREYPLKLPSDVSAKVLLGRYLQLKSRDRYKFGVRDGGKSIANRTKNLIAYPDFEELRKGELLVHYMNFISSPELSFSFHDTARTFQEMIDNQMNWFIGRDQARHNRADLRRELMDKQGHEYEAVFRVGVNKEGKYHFSDGLRSVISDEAMEHFSLGRGWPADSQVMQSYNLTRHGYIVVSSEQNTFLVRFQPFNKHPQRSFATYELVRKDEKAAYFHLISP